MTFITEQPVLLLAPESAGRGKRLTIPLDRLPANEHLPGPEPEAGFVRDLQQKGQLYPVLLEMDEAFLDLYAPGSQAAPPNGAIRVLDGRNRIKAARKLEWEDIDALVYPRGWVNPHVVALTANARRRGNPASDVVAISELQAAGADEKQIAAATGLEVQTVQKRLRLLDLTAPLLTAFCAGRIAVAVAEAACRLTEAQQERLGERLAEHGKINADDVSAVQQVGRDPRAATVAFPALFTSPPEPGRGEVPVQRVQEPVTVDVAAPVAEPPAATPRVIYVPSVTWEERVSELLLTCIEALPEVPDPVLVGHLDRAVKRLRVLVATEAGAVE